MQRQCAGLPAYLGLLLENPTLLAHGGGGRSRRAAATIALAARLRRQPHGHRRARRRGCCAGAPSRCRALLVGAIKDLTSGAAWLYGLVSRSIEWRSNRLVVLAGSRLRLADKQIGGWTKARLARAVASR